MQLVLSLMPGVDLLGMAFKEAGFCVVQGGDVIFGGDVRSEHYPPGKFDGICAGPPCQAFSRLARMVRRAGHEPKFGNLIPEFERCVQEAKPRWFVMEEVRDAPVPAPDGYGVHSFLLDNRQFGAEQERIRRISFGWRGTRRVLMLDVLAIENQNHQPTAIGGSNGPASSRERSRQKLWQRTTFRTKASFAKICEAQGLPADFLKDAPFTVAGKCKAVGNGVPMAMSRALAKAVLEAVS